MHARLRLVLLCVLISAVPTMVMAQKGRTPRHVDPTIDPFIIAAGLLDSHPDLRYRTVGLEQFGDGKYPEAFKNFQRAAFYSDKPSQAIVGEMLWAGVGVEKDRALGHAWMGLAAERGYLSFSEKHQRYWNEMTEAERARALEQAPSIRAEYSDAAAEPRLHAVLTRERKKATGSRTGSEANNVKIVVPGVGTIDSSQYYNSRYWDPKEYRHWQDSIWQELRVGQVSVGDVEQVSGDATKVTPEEKE